MSVKAMVEEMKDALDTALADAEKVDAGNKSAGTRLRKVMQDVRTSCVDVRKAVLAARK